MTGELVDKGIDEEERDDAPDRRGRRGRLVGGALAAILVVGGVLVVTEPWADDDGDTAPTGTVPDRGEPETPTLSNRLILGDVPEGYAVEWISDGVEDGFGGSADATNVLLVAPDATVQDGRWLAARVVPLDQSERRDFDPVMYTQGEGQPVAVGERKGAYVAESFDGSSQIVVGPVDDRFLVSISAEGFDRDEMIAIAAEMQLDQVDGGAAAWPAFSDRVDGLEPLASFVQPGETFADSSLYSFLGATSLASTSVSYSTGGADGIQLINDAVVPGLDTLAVARFALVDATDTTVHGLPAVMGSMEEAFGGSLVMWEEGGRSIVLFASNDLDLLALAESVTVADGPVWEALQDEADGPDDFGPDQGQPQWLIAAGELEDGTTWVAEGEIDGVGDLRVCLHLLGTDTSSSVCGGAGQSIEGPLILHAGDLDGAFGLVIVASVPLADPGATLRFTDENGQVTERALEDKSPSMPIHATAVAVTQPGTAEIVSADGQVMATDEVSEGDLG